jgi:hypothetical protein
MKKIILTTLTLLVTVTLFGQNNKVISNTNKLELIVKTSNGEVLIDKSTLAQNELANKIYSTYEDESINLDETVVIKTTNATLTGKYVMEKKDNFIYISFVYEKKDLNPTIGVADVNE